MKSLDAFLVDMSTNIPTAVVDARDGQGLGVESFSLTLPIESRIESEQMSVSLPLGKLATGFDFPHGRIRARFEKTEAWLEAPKSDQSPVTIQAAEERDSG